MTDTANLALPCIEGSQAQKHVTHNEALRLLDTLVQLAVLDRDLTTPPGSLGEGQRWIVKAGATGDWAGHDNAIAAWQDGAWQFSAPQTGWLAYVVDESVLVAWNGSAWVSAIDALTPTVLNNMTLLGVGTTADTTNPFSAKLNNALWVAKTAAEDGDGDLRYKLSKEAAANTLSFLLQDNYSGRAEIGLTGDDDFHCKVSADGTTWHDGITIAAATGKLSFPASGGPREVLSAARTYYVRSDGSDSNDGLGNSAAGAFLTLQHAYDVIVGTLDLGGQTVTIQQGTAGTLTAGLSIATSPTGGRNVILDLGGGSLSVTSADAIYAGAPVGLTVQNGTLSTTTGGNGINAAVAGADITIGASVVFGNCAARHMQAINGASISLNTNYSITGSAGSHFIVQIGGHIIFSGCAVALSGTLSFAPFAYADSGGLISVWPGSFSGGSVSGQRYIVATNAVINTFGSGASLFPGSSAGATSSGGQYT